MYTKNTTHKGFTMVETLVSITILLVVIVGPMTIASRGLQASFFANEQTTAVFLAQESIERIEKLRDGNALSVVYGLGETDTWDWYIDLNSACKNSGGCDYDSVNGGYKNCSSPGACLLRINDTSDQLIYGYGTGGSWSDTIYTRTLKVVEASPGQVEVTSEVTWSSNLFSNERKVVLQTWVYDHFNRYE